MSILSQRILNRREQLGLTQDELGRLIGKDQKQIWRYESGRVQPTAESLVALARALKTTTDYLVGESDSVQPVTADNLDSLEREILEMLRNYDASTKQRAINVLKALG